MLSTMGATNRSSVQLVYVKRHNKRGDPAIPLLQILAYWRTTWPFRSLFYIKQVFTRRNVVL
jgi:hypothetical protein